MLDLEIFDRNLHFDRGTARTENDPDSGLSIAGQPEEETPSIVHVLRWTVNRVELPPYCGAGLCRRDRRFPVARYRRVPGPAAEPRISDARLRTHTPAGLRTESVEGWFACHPSKVTIKDIGTPLPDPQPAHSQRSKRNRQPKP